MHLDIGEEIRATDVRFPFLLNVFGLSAAGQAAGRRCLVTWK
jgi:hypothetical protein